MRHSDYVVACLAIASLESHWSTSVSQEHWPVVKFCIGDTDTVNEDNEVFGSALKIWSGSDEVTAGISSISANRRTWVSGRMEADIAVIMFEPPSGAHDKNSFITTRVRLEDIRLDHAQPHGTVRRWRLRMVSQSHTPINDIPWYSQNISHAGRMIALRKDALIVYDLSSTEEQPGKTIVVPQLTSPDELNDSMTINALEPWSESLIIGLPGKVSMIRLRTDTPESIRRLRPLDNASH